MCVTDEVASVLECVFNASKIEKTGDWVDYRTSEKLLTKEQFDNAVNLVLNDDSMWDVINDTIMCALRKAGLKK